MMKLLVIAAMLWLPFADCTSEPMAGIGAACGHFGACLHPSECVMFGGKTRCIVPEPKEGCPKSQIPCSEGCCDGTCDCVGKDYCSCSSKKRIGEVCDPKSQTEKCVNTKFGKPWLDELPDEKPLECVLADSETRCSTPDNDDWNCYPPKKRCADRCCDEGEGCMCLNSQCSCGKKMVPVGGKCSPDSQCLNDDARCQKIGDSTSPRCVLTQDCFNGASCSGECCLAGEKCKCTEADCTCDKARQVITKLAAGKKCRKGSECAYGASCRLIGTSSSTRCVLDQDCYDGELCTSACCRGGKVCACTESDCGCRNVSDAVTLGGKCTSPSMMGRLRIQLFSAFASMKKNISVALGGKCTVKSQCLDGRAECRRIGDSTTPRCVIPQECFYNNPCVTKCCSNVFDKCKCTETDCACHKGSVLLVTINSTLNVCNYIPHFQNLSMQESRCRKYGFARPGKILRMVAPMRERSRSAR